MRIGLNDIVFARDGVFATAVDDELVMLDPESGSYYGAGKIGERVWIEVTQGTKVSEICEVILSQFDVERAKCEKDVLEFLNDLAAHGLVDKR